MIAAFFGYSLVCIAGYVVAGSWINVAVRHVESR